ncbi:MAG TPA: prepilin-type N-terminal cleavage/methylation domain-containing protein [Candidatus Avacidaminococcus intestinavium]|uniref:Prepilin-type N-terminal cleavage/methylation domain-containing protein n=1 Tax=Candidatus Avacidaminococcus intestinavium TaxID=2840684 RepID=A0A9D1SLP3_9FIRM|nr:prepilin-type N-terminal cleavage/methylation domain-containing protein [Candidatus Avacidaminococcus intestinavium]
MNKKFIEDKRGFTLIEIIAVLAVIGTLAVALLPSLDIVTDRTKNTKMISDLVVLDSAVKLYRFEHDSYPANLEILKKGYVPDKAYKDAKNAAFKYSIGSDDSYSLTGQKANGDVIKADGSTIQE